MWCGSQSQGVDACEHSGTQSQAVDACEHSGTLSQEVDARKHRRFFPVSIKSCVRLCLKTTTCNDTDSWFIIKRKCYKMSLAQPKCTALIVYLRAQQCPRPSTSLITHCLTRNNFCKLHPWLARRVTFFGIFLYLYHIFTLSSAYLNSPVP